MLGKIKYLEVVSKEEKGEVASRCCISLAMSYYLHVVVMC